MDTFVNVIDTAIDFGKEKLDKVIDFWDSCDENKKKLIVGCVVCAVSVIVIASIAYGLGKSRGRRLAFEDDEF